MSFVFRRPHDFRFVPVAVAVLFSGAAPSVDSPPLARTTAQERYYSHVPEIYTRAISGGKIAAPLFPVAAIADSPEIARSCASLAFFSGNKDAPFRVTNWKLNPALFPPVVTADEPPISRLDSQRKYWDSHRDTLYSSAKRVGYPLIDNGLVFSRGFEQDLFHLGYIPYNYSSNVGGARLSPSLFPAPQVDSPPLGINPASHAYHLAEKETQFYGKTWRLNPALFLPVVIADSPPLGLNPASSAYHLAAKGPEFYGKTWKINPAVFPPVVVVDSPALTVSVASIAHYAVLRYHPLIQKLRPFPESLFPEPLQPDDPPIGKIESQRKYWEASRPYEHYLPYRVGVPFLVPEIVIGIAENVNLITTITTGINLASAITNEITLTTVIKE